MSDDVGHRDERVEIVFGHPVTVDGEKVERVQMRNPLARDSRDAQRSGGTQAEIEMRLFANLCEVSPKVVDVLDMSDYLKLQRQFEDFLAG